MEFDLDVRVSANSSEFVRKKMKMPEGIHEFEEQMFGLITWKQLNPVYQAARKLTGIKDFTKYQRTVAENGKRARETLMAYVQMRKRGERKS